MPRPHGDQAATWWGAAFPTSFPTLSAWTWIGITCNFLAPGRVFGVRCAIPTSSTKPTVGIFWNRDTGELLRAIAFNQNGPTNPALWQNAWFRPTVRIAVGTTYRFAVMRGNSYYRTVNGLLVPVAHGNIRFVDGWQTTSIYPPAITLTATTSANGVDVLFQPD